MALGTASPLDSLLHRPEQESLWNRLLNSPLTTIATLLYNHFAQKPVSNHYEPPIRLVCISDTHNTTPALPDGDLLIHAGDLTQSGTRAELDAQIAWLDEQPHRYKLVIAGNHELCLDPSQPAYDPTALDWKSLIYLHASSMQLSFGSRRVNVFGAPYTPRHGNWAFQYPRSDDFWNTVEMEIPDHDGAMDMDMDVNVLITHGPPRGHLDLGRGCASLRACLWRLPPLRRPAVHVFGHVHGGYGVERARWDGLQRAYEGVVDGRAKWVNFVLVGWYAVRRMLGLGGIGSGSGRETVMVNGAAVGGVRDEKRRGAICVDI
ncbi:metallophosphatase domain-containing protein [Aspergillus clavatus NRRL 1]|uniref:Phosphoesterase, putative n=1 Tax=Aspergillus clavatus (strain ATCC 1007 / CBS 513.65 / DSM 816 / NCTC 3887 / NRRL 1 / QM 1276 / 107) TaxID=344612 RepID=A1C857_ASPCL|nr:phosphoesterase, putative [Aspergillus clavatus NRRL 1]EAW14578.1 phosphoesterase, putative [Aspergillus clavatus NRRL 1]